MGKRRPNQCTVVIGKKATGKSTLLRMIANNYVRDNREKNKRGCIIDVNNSPAYADLPELTLRQMSLWLPDADLRLARCYNSDHNQLFAALIKGFRGGLLIFEDCTKYIPANPSQQVKTFLVDHRMWDADLIFTFHSIADVPTSFWRMATNIILLKTQDTEEWLKRKHNIPNLKELMVAFRDVNKDRNPYASRLIDTYV